MWWYRFGIVFGQTVAIVSVRKRKTDANKRNAARKRPHGKAMATTLKPRSISVDCHSIRCGEFGVDYRVVDYSPLGLVDSVVGDNLQVD